MRKRKGERSCGECSSEGKGVICWKSEGELLSPFSWMGGGGGGVVKVFGFVWGLTTWRRGRTSKEKEWEGRSLECRFGLFLFYLIRKALERQ